MSRPKLKSLDMATLERIVTDNVKQRFTMRKEPTGAGGEEELWIRANQGHSLVVSLCLACGRSNFCRRVLIVLICCTG